jgi:hypothetical protein
VRIKRGKLIAHPDPIQDCEGEGVSYEGGRTDGQEERGKVSVRTRGLEGELGSQSDPGEKPNGER